MTDRITVNGDGRLQLSAALKWIATVTGVLFTGAVIGLFTNLQSNGTMLGRIDERLIAFEARVARLEAAVVAGTSDRYTGIDAERDQAAIDRRLNEMSSRLLSLERLLYEGQR